MYKDYRKTDRSVSLLAANLIAIFFALPLFGGLLPLYAWIWGPQVVNLETSFQLGHVILFLVAFFGGITIHELLHGITWQFIGRKPRSAIEYGIKWKLLTPYAHVKEPLDVRVYRIGGFMPGLVLGLLPTFAAFILGNGWLLSFGLLFTWTAAGDFTILWLLRNVKPGTLVEDHPDRAGCVLLEKVG